MGCLDSGSSGRTAKSSLQSNFSSRQLYLSGYLLSQERNEETHSEFSREVVDLHANLFFWLAVDPDSKYGFLHFYHGLHVIT